MSTRPAGTKKKNFSGRLTRQGLAITCWTMLLLMLRRSSLGKRTLQGQGGWACSPHTTTPARLSPAKLHLMEHRPELGSAVRSNLPGLDHVCRFLAATVAYPHAGSSHYRLSHPASQPCHACMAAPVIRPPSNSTSNKACRNRSHDHRPPEYLSWC